MTDSKTTLELAAEYRKEREKIDALWQSIYDQCSKGNGASGFEIFGAALSDAHQKGVLDERTRILKWLM